MINEINKISRIQDRSESIFSHENNKIALTRCLNFLDFNDKIKLVNTSRVLRKILLSEDFISKFTSEEFLNQDKTNIKNVIKKVLKNNTNSGSSFNLKSVFLQFVNDITSEDLHLLNKNNKISELSINACHKVNQDLFNSLKNFTNLTKLELYWMPQINNLEAFFSGNNANSLVEINFSGCIGLTEKTYELMISNCSDNLKTLNLTRNLGLNDTLIKNIAKKFKKLEVLNLYALSKLNPDFLSLLGENLELLDICGNQLVVDHHIYSIKSKKIKHLNLVSLKLLIFSY